MIDSSMIVEQMLLQLLWMFPIIVIILFFKSSTGKGIVGETLLNIAMRKTLDKKKYQLLKNITLPTEDGTTQIDQIIVSQYGIFVIETKNMRGWIFGSVNQKIWTQNIYGKKYTFQNPLYQNYKHVKVLQKLLKLDDDKVFSVVVFVGESTFKTNMPSNVVYPLGLLSFIKSHQTIVFTPREMWRIVGEIKNAQLAKGFKTNKVHVQNLKASFNNIPEKLVVKREFKNTLRCPRCGGELIIRTAKKGSYKGSKFYGCASYPRCKYIKSKT